MENTQSRYGWLTSLGMFAAWVVTSLGALIDGLYIREAVLAVLQTLQMIDAQLYRKRGGVGLDLQYGYGLTLADDVLLIILACSALAFVILIDVYYRKGRRVGQLWKRVGTVAVVEVAIFVLMALVVLYI